MTSPINLSNDPRAPAAPPPPPPPSAEMTATASAPAATTAGAANNRAVFQTLHGANDIRFDRFARSITYKLRKVTCIANIESLQSIFKFYEPEIAARHVAPQSVWV